MHEVFEIVPASSKPLWFIGAICLVLFSLTCAFGYIAYSTRHIVFEVSSSGLSIKGGMYGRNIPRDDLLLSEARIVDLSRERELQPWLRTNGVGLPGYGAGWFKLRGGKKALLFLTERRRVVYLPTRAGYSALLSVVDPERFIEALRGA